MFDIEEPRSTEALRAGLRQLHAEITEFVESMSETEFLAKQGEFWSPAEHIRHLSTAVRAVARGLAAPKVALMLRFGLTFGGSRTFDEVRDAYRAALEAGGKASGRYDPTTRRLDLEAEDERALVLERWAKVGAELDAAAAGWSETALDHLRARHPLLGMMTVRELLYFTLYHNAHHARRIRERRKRRA